jgi:hypothetical protein
MATTKERLEQIENALLVLAGGATGYSVAQRGVAGTARPVARVAVGTPQGRALLAAVSYSELVNEINERDREIAQAEGTENIFFEAQRRLGGPVPIAPGFLTSMAEAPAKKTKKRVKSKFNKAVSGGMKAVRSSKFYGKKGTINNAKRAFGAVTKVASKVNQGKKVSTKGVTGVISRAVKRIL